MTAARRSITSVGLIGFGRWGRHIFRDLRSLGVTVHVAVPGPDSRQEALAAGAATAHGHLCDLPEVDGYGLMIVERVHELRQPAGLA